MKILRAFVIGLIGLEAFAVCALLGSKIGSSLGGDGFSAIAGALSGFMIGSLVGVIVAIVAARYFADHVWVGENPWKEVLAFYGVIIAAYIGYLGMRSQTKIPIRATQTAEAKLTPVAQDSIPFISITLGSTATSSMIPSIINSPTSTPTPISTHARSNVPSWPTGTPLPSIQPGQGFVLTQIHMMDENVGWGVEAAGHLLRTMDGGSTWKDVTPPQVGFYSIGDTMHAWDIVETRERCELLGCSIDWAPGLMTWYTSDGGQTWQQGSFFIGQDTDFRPRAMQFVNDANGWFLFVNKTGMSGFTFESLVRTMDGGESWIHVPFLSNGCISGGMIFVDEQEGWIGDDCRSLSNMLDGIAWPDFLNGKAAPSLNRTTDGGNTWTLFPVPAPTVFPSNLTSRNPDPNVWFYCGIQEMDKISHKAFLLQWSCNTAYSTISAEASYAYLTIDRGQTWHSWLSTGNENFINTTIGWRLFTRDEGQPNSLQQTTDGGLAWMTIKEVVWQTAQLDFVSEQVGWAIVSDGNNSILVHTIDSGKTWTEMKPIIAP